jgi:hypothetical protein
MNSANRFRSWLAPRASRNARRRFARLGLLALEDRTVPAGVGIQDGGFEAMALAPATFRYDPAGSPWTFGGTAGISGNGSDFTAANPAGPQGNQVAFLQDRGTVTQTVNFTAGTYTLAFSAAERASNATGIESFEVTVDGAVVGSFNSIVGTTYQTQSTSSFTVTAGNHVVSFIGTNANGGDNTIFLDQVSATLQSAPLNDSGFELPALAGGTFKYNPTGSPWTFTGTAGVAENGSAFSAGNPAAPQASQVAFLQANGGIGQAVNFAAGTYMIRFAAAQRGNAGGNQTFQVLVDGQVVGTFNGLAGTAFSAQSTTSFTVTAGTHTITFQGTNLNGGDNTALIDQVAINQFTTSLTDPGFEQLPLGPNGYTFGPTGSAWAFAGTAGVSGNGTAFTSGNSSAPQGSQVAFLQVNGSMSQSALISAGTYTLSFFAAQRGNGGGNQTFQVLVDGSTVDTLNSFGGSGYSLLTTSSFTLSAGAHTFSFRGTDLNGGDNTVFIDQVTLNQQAVGLADSGFEASSAAPVSYAYDPTGTPWNYTGTAGVAVNGSAFTAGNAVAPQGGQVLFLQQTGSVNQTVSFPAGTFTISLSAAKRMNAGGNQTIQVLVDGNLVGTFSNLSGPAYSTLTTNSFTVAAGNHIVTFRGNATGDDTAFLDNVTVNNASPAPLSATIGNGGPVNEGSAGAVSFTNVTGGSGQYTYSYDFNNDGAFEIANSAQSTATVPAQYLTPGTRVVHGRVTDSSGSFVDYTTSMTVNNLPPAVTPGGSGQTSVQGVAATFNLGSFTDPGANDGPWSVTVSWGDSTTSTISATVQGSLTAIHAYATGGNYTATVNVTDKYGATGSAQTSVVVSSPLTGMFGNGGSVNEGSTGTVSFTNVTGGIGPYTYSYDFNNDGTFEITNNSQASATVPAQYLADGPAAQVVHGRVTDSSGVSVDHTTSITVNNVPPTVTPSMPGQTAAQGASTLLSIGSFSDPGIKDAPWTVAVNWGDSTSSTFSTSAQGALSYVHNYGGTGSFTITTTLTDKDGGSASAATSVTVVQSTSTASVLKIDATTAGNWKGIYGSDGYYVVGDATSYPAYAQVTTDTATSVVSDPSSDVRDLQKASNLGTRIAAKAYNGATWVDTIDVNLTDGQPHVLAIYLRDLSIGGGMTETVTASDATTGATLASQTVSFSDTYLIWKVSGHVRFQITSNSAGFAAIFSGLFFSPYSTNPVLTAPASQTVSAGLSPTVNLGSLSDPASGGPWAVSVNWGDGTSLTSFSAAAQGPLTRVHSYAGPGNYSVQVTATNPGGGTGSESFPVTVAQPQTDTDPYIVTPYDRIPNFGANPTIVSVRGGAWSDPTTWSLGRVPVAGDVVSINPGMTVTYDTVSTAAVNTVVIQATGHLVFRTDVNTTLTVTNLLVLEGGELQVGTSSNPVAPTVKAQIIFADTPLNTAIDPSQYGNGLIALGKVTMHGAVKNATFVRLAAEAKAGTTTLSLSQPVTGWQVGDKLVLPDTRQLADPQTGAGFSPQWELVSVAGISSDGLTVTVSNPLSFDHLGARDGDGALTFLPYVGDLTRNVVVRSANASGTRGQTLFTGRADVDIEYAQFSGLGRTTENPPDDTTYAVDGTVSHVGTNQSGRLPVQFRYLLGPATAPQDGYQYTFAGNSVFCPLNPMPFRWGITIQGSNYGLIQNNVLYNWRGAGIIALDGTESYNVIDHNYVVATMGTKDAPMTEWSRADDRGMQDLGFEGVSYWFRGFNNYVTNNVASDAESYGYTYFAEYLGSVNVPLFPGADPAVNGQTAVQNENDTPILQFSGNEVFGATVSGMTIWWLGTISDTPYADAAESVVKDFHAWNVHREGFFGYQTNRLTLDGLVVRGDTSQMAGGNTRGVWGGDYFTKDMVITNADIQGMHYGWQPSSDTGGGTQTIENSYLRNYYNVFLQPMQTAASTSDWLMARTSIVRDVTFATPNVPDLTDGSPPKQDIVMWGTPGSDVATLIQHDQLFVYDYNKVVGDNFQVYYLEQATNFLLPQSTLNPDGSPRLDASPETGLTNAQAWTKYGVAFGGAISPTTATRAKIRGFVQVI